MTKEKLTALDDLALELLERNRGDQAMLVLDAIRIINAGNDMYRAILRYINRTPLSDDFEDALRDMLTKVDAAMKLEKL